MTISIVEIVSDTAHLSKQKIHEVIKEHEDKILYVSYILHDKDKYTVCDEEREEERAAKENRTVDPNVKAGNLKKTTLSCNDFVCREEKTIIVQDDCQLVRVGRKLCQ